MPSDSKDPSTARSPWPMLIGGLLILGVALTAFLMINGPSKDPGTVVRTFASTLESDRPRAHLMLGPVAQYDLTPVSPAEADRRDADAYLRSEGIQVVAVYPGEPVDGRQVDRPDTFTLATRGKASLPLQRILKGGEAGMPSSTSLLNAEIIVEVRDGKIHVLRSELAR